MRGGRAVFLVDHFEIPEGSLAAVPVESGVARPARALRGQGRARRRRRAAAERPRRLLLRVHAVPHRLPLVAARARRGARPRAPRQRPARGHRAARGRAAWSRPCPPAARVKATVLARSSPEAYRESGNYDFSPQPRREVDRVAEPRRRAPAGRAAHRPLPELLARQGPARRRRPAATAPKFRARERRDLDPRRRHLAARAAGFSAAVPRERRRSCSTRSTG